MQNQQHQNLSVNKVSQKMSTLDEEWNLSAAQTTLVTRPQASWESSRRSMLSAFMLWECGRRSPKLQRFVCRSWKIAPIGRGDECTEECARFHIWRWLVIEAVWVIVESWPSSLEISIGRGWKCEFLEWTCRRLKVALSVWKVSGNATRICMSRFQHLVRLFLV